MAVFCRALGGWSQIHSCEPQGLNVECQKFQYEECSWILRIEPALTYAQDYVSWLQVCQFVLGSLWGWFVCSSTWLLFLRFISSTLMVLIHYLWALQVSEWDCTVWWTLGNWQLGVEHTDWLLYKDLSRLHGNTTIIINDFISPDVNERGCTGWEWRQAFVSKSWASWWLVWVRLSEHAQRVLGSHVHQSNQT